MPKRFNGNPEPTRRLLACEPFVTGWSDGPVTAREARPTRPRVS